MTRSSAFFRDKGDAMENKKTVRLVEFDCTEVTLPKGTPAVPRPATQPRKKIASTLENQSLFESFDCDITDLPPGTKAQPRPKGRERQFLGDIPAGEPSLQDDSPLQPTQTDPFQ